MLQDLNSETIVTLVPLGFVEEINHRVVNEFAEAVSSLSLAAARSPGGASRESLEGAAERLLAHAELHRALLRPLDRRPNLADYLGRICSGFSKAFLAERGVRLQMKCDDVRISADRCWRVGLIVAELIRNAARHGLRGMPGAIVVELRQRANTITCLIGDDGRADPQPRPGKGRELISLLAAELGGSVEWRFTDLGTIAGLEIPIDQPLDPIALS